MPDAASQFPKILVVDDEPRFRRTLARLLEARGLTVRAAGSGEEALAVLAETPVDVVVLDIKMPDMNGREVLRRMNAQGCRAEVIVLSGHASIDAAMDVMARGACDFLLKPCDVEDLDVKISLAYDRKCEKDKVRDRLKS